MRLSGCLNWNFGSKNEENEFGPRQITGTAIFLAGLKKGIGTTFAETVWRTASTVISMLSFDPTAEL